MRITVRTAGEVVYPLAQACTSIKDFGATGDGVQNTAPALQQAVNSVSTGCSILFPPGTYLFRTNGVNFGSKDISILLTRRAKIVFDVDNGIPTWSGTGRISIIGETPLSSEVNVLRNTTAHGSMMSCGTLELQRLKITVSGSNRTSAGQEVTATDLFIRECVFTDGLAFYFRYINRDVHVEDAHSSGDFNWLWISNDTGHSLRRRWFMRKVRIEANTNLTGFRIWGQREVTIDDVVAKGSGMNTQLFRIVGRPEGTNEKRVSISNVHLDLSQATPSPQQLLYLQAWRHIYHLSVVIAGCACRFGDTTAEPAIDVEDQTSTETYTSKVTVVASQFVGQNRTGYMLKRRGTAPLGIQVTTAGNLLIGQWAGEVQ